jgi:hypothetical protein
MEPPAVTQSMGARFDNVAELYGFTLGAQGTKVKAGETVELNLVWRALSPTATDYAIFVHLADSTQRPWSQHDGPPAEGRRPTSGWVPGEYVTDGRRIAVKADVPPGRYGLLVGMYGPDGKRLEVTSPGGAQVGNVLPLAGIEIEVLP